MKRPAFQFYPSDWRGDMPLQSCSIAARGLWHELLCVMHECSPYGHLAVNGAAMPEANIARAAGVSVAEYRRAMIELEKANVFSKTFEGVVYSRRMVKDERLRNVRAESGKKGGNPNLVNQMDNQMDNQPAKQSPTPSSSSSSSTSKPTSRAEPLADARPATASSGTRLDSLWTLPLEWLEWAIGERPDWNSVEAERVALVFRDHWHAKAGADARKVDWFACWRNWVKKERRQYAVVKEPTLAERRARNMDILTGRVRDERTVEGVAKRVDSAVVLSLPSDLRESSGDDVGRLGHERSAGGVG